MSPIENEKNGRSSTGLQAREGPITPKHTGQALLMMPSINEITANTIKTWIRPPTLYTNTPKSHPIKRMTAIK
jgi:hypothetical protein